MLSKTSSHTLTVNGLGKSYDETDVLKDISFTLEGGLSIAFMSPSGSGKSTLLSLLGLLLEPTAGSIMIDGRDVADLSDDEISALRNTMFGFMFQHVQLIGSLRAVENVMVPALFQEKRDLDIKERAQALLKDFGLADRMNYFPYQLSVGQKRRIALARTLLLDPPIIIADEPTNDLDGDSAGRVSDVLFDRVDKGALLLMATHDRALAERASTIMRYEGGTFK